MIFATILAAAAMQVNCADAMTQADMNICSYQDYQEADKALNKTWERAAAAARNQSPAAFNRLRDAQRKWIAFRDAHCLAENGPREESGSIWPLIQNGCMKHLTEARTTQLRDYVETGN